MAEDDCECRPLENGLRECYNTYYEFNPTQTQFSMGNHDHDYFITLTITNIAEIFITPTLKVNTLTLVILWLRLMLTNNFVHVFENICRHALD